MLDVVTVRGGAGYLFQMLRGEKTRVEDLFLFNTDCLILPVPDVSDSVGPCCWVLKMGLCVVLCTH